MQVYIDECLWGLSIYSSGSTSAHSLFIEPENVCIDDARMVAFGRDVYISLPLGLLLPSTVLHIMDQHHAMMIVKMFHIYRMFDCIY